ncbi:MAG TPA: alpha/beta fold hydrolase, partial [bacterium]|nr:alpha/beta fold hydrolase [bacterium]
GADPTPRASVTFESCLAAATAFIESEGIEEFVLVGHSLAGILLPELAAAHPGKIRGVVFVAAFVLNRGERVIDLIAPERVPEYRRLAEADPGRSVMLPYAAARERFFNDLDEAAARAAYARLTPQPLAPYFAPARLDPRGVGSLSRYLVCRRDRNLPPGVCRGYAAKLVVPVEEIDAGHDAMLSRPAELASLLLRRGPARGDNCA